ncbi:hypothetical protein Misp06_01477 [Microbulbifer sp. NBRC 101763]
MANQDDIVKLLPFNDADYIFNKSFDTNAGVD